ncbi:MAG TPA: hypothetical protein VGM17_15660 [Rhizomicrobium sp.]|jgi:hypothetical protein
MLPMLRQLQTKIVLALIAALAATILLSVMLVFACIAVYVALGNLFEPWAAALLTAAAAVVLLLLILLVLKLIGRAAKSRRPPPAAKSEFPFNLLHQYASQFGKGGAANSPLTLAGLFVLGFALGMSPKLRSLLFKLVI